MSTGRFPEMLSRRILVLSGSNHAVVAQSRTNEQCIEFESGMPTQPLSQAYMGTRGRPNGLPMCPSWGPRCVGHLSIRDTLSRELGRQESGRQRLRCHCHSLPCWRIPATRAWARRRLQSYRLQCVEVLVHNDISIY